MSPLPAINYFLSPQCSFTWYNGFSICLSSFSLSLPLSQPWKLGMVSPQKRRLKRALRPSSQGRLHFPPSFWEQSFLVLHEWESRFDLVVSFIEDFERHGFELLLLFLAVLCSIATMVVGSHLAFYSNFTDVITKSL